MQDNEAFTERKLNGECKEISYGYIENYMEDEGEDVEIQQRGNKSEDKRRMTALNGGEESE